MAEEVPVKAYKCIAKLREFAPVESTINTVSSCYEYAKTNSYLARLGLSVLSYSWGKTTSTANYITSLGPVERVWEPTKKIAEDRVVKLDDAICSLLENLSLSEINHTTKDKLSSPGKALSFGVDVSKSIASKGFDALCNSMTKIPILKNVVPEKEQFINRLQALPVVNFIFISYGESTSKKRKRNEKSDSEASECDSEEDYMEELLNDENEQEYDSAEDPDYDPTKDEQNERECSDEEEEDDEEDIRDAKEFLESEKEKKNDKGGALVKDGSDKLESSEGEKDDKEKEKEASTQSKTPDGLKEKEVSEDHPPSPKTDENIQETKTTQENKNKGSSV